MLELILVFALGVVLGHKISDLLAVWAFRQMLKDLGITDQDLRAAAAKQGLKLPAIEDPSDSSLEVIHIRLEQHSGQIFAFRSDTGLFLAQGTSRTQLIDHLKTRMNNVRLIVDEGSDLIQKPEEA